MHEGTQRGARADNDGEEALPMRYSTFGRPTLAAASLALLLAACGPLAEPEVVRPTAGPTAPASAPSAPPAAPNEPAQPSAPPAAPTSGAGVPIDPASPAPERISFAPGSSAAAVEGAIVRGTQNTYLLRASAGQQMDLAISSLENNAVFSLAGPDGQALEGARPGQDARAWSGALPLDGDYTLTVGSTRGNASFTLSVSIAPVAQQPAGDIRSADWPAVIANDPGLEREQFDGRLRVSLPGQEVGGHPVLDAIVYVDLDGDGVEEAAIPLNSGGTAGDIGFLVYRLGARGPQLAAAQGGYKLGVREEHGRLVVSNALYAGFEPNCCPSGLRYTSYALAGGQLVVTATRDEPFAEMQAPTVERFYALLASGDLAVAYAMLAEGERQANSYEQWAAGYARTQTIEAAVSADGSPDTVRVDLVATDLGDDGSQQTRRFSGSWRLVWSPALPGWTLDSPQFVEQ
jgi:hypothetical protein